MDTTLLLLVVAVVVIVAFDFSNGFHDTANLIATAVASRALRPAQAALIAGAEGNETGASPADCFEAVVQILKRREVYRHLSNAADRVASAAETLHAIVVKWT